MVDGDRTSRRFPAGSDRARPRPRARAQPASHGPNGPRTSGDRRARPRLNCRLPSLLSNGARGGGPRRPCRTTHRRAPPVACTGTPAPGACAGRTAQRAAADTVRLFLDGRGARRHAAGCRVRLEDDAPPGARYRPASRSGLCCCRRWRSAATCRPSPRPAAPSHPSRPGLVHAPLGVLVLSAGPAHAGRGVPERSHAASPTRPARRPRRRAAGPFLNCNDARHAGGPRRGCWPTRRPAPRRCTCCCCPP